MSELVGKETRKTPTFHKVNFISEASKTCFLQIPTQKNTTPFFFL